VLRSFAERKTFRSRRLANTASFLHFFSLQTLPFLAPDGITDFGIALAKHCNLAFCFFVLQINWSKTFFDRTKQNGLSKFICSWCNASILAIGKKCVSTLCSTLWRNKGRSSVAATSRRHKKLRNHWYQTSTTAELALLLKHANGIVFATFVQ